MQALRYEATVGPDHALHVPTPELVEGEMAEIIVLVRDKPAQTKRKFSDAMGHHPRFKNLDEVNAYVNQLRED